MSTLLTPNISPTQAACGRRLTRVRGLKRLTTWLARVYVQKVSVPLMCAQYNSNSVHRGRAKQHEAVTAG